MGLKEVSSRRVVLRSNVQAMLGVLLVLLYQWSLFEATSISSMTSVLKGVIPCVIIIFNKPKYTFSVYLKGVVLLYLIVTVIFLSWMALSSILNSTTLEFSLLQTLKFYSRILAFMAFVTIASQRSALHSTLKMLVYVGLFTVIQYVTIVILWGNVGIFEILGTRGEYYGPVGILGSMSAYMYLPNGGVFLRSTGFWYEPSHLSVFMFSIFFVSRYLYSLSGLQRWNLYSILFLIVGACSLSMAGYFSFGIGVMFYLAFSRPRYWKVYFIIGVLVSVGSLTARVIPDDYVSMNSITKTLIKHKGDVGLNEASGGRLDATIKGVSVFIENPFGVGMKIPGYTEGENSDNYVKHALGNDYLLWMIMGGVPALMLLLLRDSLLLIFLQKNALSVMAFTVSIENISHAMIYDSLFSMMTLLFSAIVLSKREQLSMHKI